MMNCLLSIGARLLRRWARWTGGPGHRLLRACVSRVVRSRRGPLWGQRVVPQSVGDVGALDVPCLSSWAEVSARSPLAPVASCGWSPPVGAPCLEHCVPGGVSVVCSGVCRCGVGVGPPVLSSLG